MKKTLFVFMMCSSMMFSMAAASSVEIADYNRDYETSVCIYEETALPDECDLFQEDDINYYADENSETCLNTISEEWPTGTVRLEADFFSFGLLIRALIIGVVAAIIIVGGMAAQHKSVIKKYGASDYLKKDSFVVTSKKDVFLYKNVIKSKRQDHDD